MQQSTVRIRTRQADRLDRYNVQVVQPDRLLVLVRDNGNGKRKLPSGSVLVRGLYPGSKHVEGFDTFERGAYSADAGLCITGVRQLLERNALQETLATVHDLSVQLRVFSRLADQSWGFRTEPLKEVLEQLRSERGRFRNVHKVELEEILRAFISRQDRTGRRNIGAVAARSRRVPRLVQQRTAELDRIRRFVTQRSDEVWRLIDSTVRLFSDLGALIGSALFRKGPPAGAFVEPNPIQLHKLAVNTSKVADELALVVVRPFDRVARLCVRDVAELSRLIHNGGEWSRGSALFVASRKLALQLYTACRAVRVHDELRRERKLVELNLPFGEAPRITISSVAAACATVSSWIQRVPDDVDHGLDYPFKVRTARWVEAANDAAQLLLNGAIDPGEGLSNLNTALNDACEALMYGEVRS